MILFIGHDASLTGAPRMFLYLIQYIKKHTKHEIEIILHEGGEFIDEYNAISKGHIWHKPWKYEPNLLKRLKNRFFDSDSYRQKQILKYFKKKKPDVIVNNTIVNGEIIEALNTLQKPIITIVHELEYVMRLFEALYGTTSLTLNYTTEFTAASEATKRNLVENFNIPNEKVTVCYETVPYFKIDNNVDIDQLKESLNIPKDAFVVGSCGGMGWRKGSDLFIRVAQELRNINNIIFVWIGGNRKGGSYFEFGYEAKQFDILDKIRIIPYEKDISKYYQLLNVFLMTSREDPFPLVNLEAALHGVPIIAFKRSGGTEELLDETSGIVVDYCNTGQMAEQVLYIKNNKDINERLARGIKQKSDLFNTEEPFQRIYRVIKKYL